MSVGVAIASLGLITEAVADEQKLAAKRAEPKSPVMGGLYGVDLSDLRSFWSQNVSNPLRRLSF